MSDNAVAELHYIERNFDIRKAESEFGVDAAKQQLRAEMEAWANPLYEQGYTEMWQWQDPMDFYDTVTLRVQRPR